MILRSTKRVMSISNQKVAHFSSEPPRSNLFNLGDDKFDTHKEKRSNLFSQNMFG